MWKCVSFITTGSVRLLCSSAAAMPALEVAMRDQAYRDGADVAPDVAGSVADLLGRHRGVDLAEQLRPAIPGVQVGERDVRIDREELRLLHGAGRALPVERVGCLAGQHVRVEQLRV